MAKIKRISEIVSLIKDAYLEGIENDRPFYSHEAGSMLFEVIVNLRYGRGIHSAEIFCNPVPLKAGTIFLTPETQKKFRLLYSIKENLNKIVINAPNPDGCRNHPLVDKIEGIHAQFLGRGFIFDLSSLVVEETPTSAEYYIEEIE